MIDITVIIIATLTKKNKTIIFNEKVGVMNKYLYSCIGDNTKENREWLEKVGRDSANQLSFTLDGNYPLVAYERGVTLAFDPEYIKSHILERESYIDCRNNPPLFRAITALREDSDYMQWFINNHTEQWKLADIFMLRNEWIEWDDWSKATKDELINKFK